MKLFISIIFSFLLASAMATTITSNGNGGGNWSDPATWDLGVPNSSDDVIIADGDIIAVDITNAACLSLTIIDDGAGIDGGNFNINSGDNLSVTNGITFNFSNTGHESFNSGGPAACSLSLGGNFSGITTNGIVTWGLTSNFTINYNGTGAQTISKDVPYQNLTISGAHTTNNVTLESGTISVAVNYNMTATFTSGGFVTTGNTMSFSGTTSITGTGTIPLNGLTIASGTLTSYSGTIHLSDGFTNNGTFTHNNGTISLKDNNLISGTTTFYNLAINNAGVVGNGVRFKNGQTFTIANNFTGNGTSLLPTKIKSDLNGSFFTLSKSSGTVSVSYMSIRDSHAVGGATFNDTNGTDLGGNSGWNFLVGTSNGGVAIFFR